MAGYNTAFLTLAMVAMAGLLLIVIAMPETTPSPKGSRSDGASTTGRDVQRPTRRTGSTLLNELGFNSDWIEKCLAHEDGRSSRGVYNKAQYEVQRRHMMQEWSDIIDAWVAGKKRKPVLIPPSMPLFEPDPALEPGVTAVA